MDFNGMKLYTTVKNKFQIQLSLKNLSSPWSVIYTKNKTETFRFRVSLRQRVCFGLNSDSINLRQQFSLKWKKVELNCVLPFSFLQNITSIDFGFQWHETLHRNVKINFKFSLFLTICHRLDLSFRQSIRQRLR